MRKVCRSVAFAWLFVVLGTVVPAAPATAQSFFEKLIDLVSTAPPAEEKREPVPSLKSFSRTSPYGGYGYGYGADDTSPQSYPSYAPPNSSATTYRTLCVRMCDGYYWPISASVSRGRLYHDADVCRSSCDSEARLFFLPRGSDDVEHMTDISGRIYGRLPEAFAYRKTLVAGCSCRAEPWSESEARRHQAYAELEAAKAKGEIPAAVADARIANYGARIETGAVPQSRSESAAEPGQSAAVTGWAMSAPPRTARRPASDLDFFGWW